MNKGEAVLNLVSVLMVIITSTTAAVAISAALWTKDLKKKLNWLILAVLAIYLHEVSTAVLGQLLPAAL